MRQREMTPTQVRDDYNILDLALRESVRSERHFKPQDI